MLSERSPLYSHLAKTLHGMSVIRAYKMEKEMIGKFDHLQNVHTAPCFALKCGVNGWLVINANLVVSIFLTVTVFTALIMDQAGGKICH